jgi:hypothetical protein
MKKNIIGAIIIFLILISTNILVVYAEKSDNNDLKISIIKKVNNLNDPPNPASNPNPLNNSINVDININLSWMGSDPDSQDILTYNIFFGVTTNPPNVEIVFPLTEFNPGILIYATQYYWRIDTYDGQGGATTGSLWTFTTKDDTPPYIPSNPSPLNNSVDVDVFSNLSWVGVSWVGGDPDGDNVTYDVYFGILSNPPLVESDLENLTFTPGILTYNTQYYWRIDAWDTYGYSTTGPLWTFTTPENKSTNIHIDSILSWSGGDPDGDNVTYDVYFGENENPVKIISNQTENYYQTNVMNITTTYYWMIVSWDSLGKSTKGPLWNFKTSIYENNPPEKPSTPEGTPTGKPGISYSYSSSSTDSNGEPIFYMFDWDDGTLSEWIGPFDSGQTITTSHTWNNKGSYAIKVKAKDIYGGESFWSDPLTITMPKSNKFNNILVEIILRNWDIYWLLKLIIF